MNNIEETVKSAVKVSKKGIQLSWWLIVIALVAFSAVFYLLGATKKAEPNKMANKKPDTTQEVNIQQVISSMRGDIERGYESSKTYANWKPADASVSKIKSLGGDLKTKLTQSTYMVYTKLPSSKWYFCIDNKFTGQLEKVGSASCK